MLTGFEVIETADYINQVTAEERAAAQMRPYLNAYASWGVSYDPAAGTLVYDSSIVNAIYDPDGMGSIVMNNSTINAVGLQIHRNPDGVIRAVSSMTTEEISLILDEAIGVYWSGDSWNGRAE